MTNFIVGIECGSLKRDEVEFTILQLASIAVTWHLVEEKRLSSLTLSTDKINKVVYKTIEKRGKKSVGWREEKKGGSPGYDSK